MPNRAVYAGLAWVAATATAMAVVWAGLDSVIPAATDGPHVATVAAWPVQDAAQYGTDSPHSEKPSPSPASSSPATTVAHTSGTIPPASTTTSAAAKPSSPPASSPPPSAPSSKAGSPTTSAASSSSGTEQRYTTAGGTAVLTLYANSAKLDAAIPAAGFSAQSWTNSDELEVEFSPASGGTVYEVIATWNGTSPQVNTYAVGG